MFLVLLGKLLGHIVCKEGFLVGPDKVKAIRSMLLPTNSTGARRFNGAIGFYHQYIHKYVDVYALLSRLIGIKKKILWEINAF